MDVSNSTTSNYGHVFRTSAFVWYVYVGNGLCVVFVYRVRAIVSGYEYYAPILVSLRSRDSNLGLLGGEDFI